MLDHDVTDRFIWQGPENLRSSVSRRLYRLVKAAILKNYDLMPEAYRQRFRSHWKADGQSYLEFIKDKGEQFDKWWSSKNTIEECDKLKQLILMEEFMNCVPDEVKVYLNERKLETTNEMAVTADILLPIRKREEQVMRQIGTKSGQSPHGDIWGNNRGIKETQPSNDERPLMRKENRLMVCYLCGKPGHMVSQCQSGKGPRTNRIPMSKPQRVVRTNKIEEIYRPFVSWGFIWDPKWNQEIGINILRDTGATHSLILRRWKSEGARNSVNKTVIIDGISGEPWKPLYIGSTWDSYESQDPSPWRW